MNRRMGFVWDKSFLKSSIHNADVSVLKSYDESTGHSGYDAKLETDYVEYRFLIPPQYTDFEKSVIIGETCGQPVPMAAKEELIRKTSAGELPQEGRKVSRRDVLKEEKEKAHHKKAQASSGDDWKQQQPLASQDAIIEQERQPPTLYSQDQLGRDRIVPQGWERKDEPVRQQIGVQPVPIEIVNKEPVPVIEKEEGALV